MLNPQPRYHNPVTNNCIIPKPWHSSISSTWRLKNRKKKYDLSLKSWSRSNCKGPKYIQCDESGKKIKGRRISSVNICCRLQLSKILFFITYLISQYSTFFICSLWNCSIVLEHKIGGNQMTQKKSQIILNYFSKWKIYWEKRIQFSDLIFSYCFLFDENFLIGKQRSRRDMIQKISM